MRRILSVALLSLIGIICIQAQNVVNLKNGSIIRGEVVEYIPNEKVSIKTPDGSLFVYTTEEVENVLKDENYVAVNQDADRYLAPRGYRGFVDVCPYLGNLSVSTTHGFQFCHGFFMGGGIKYMYTGNSQTLPIYLALQSNVSRKKAQFTYGGRLGWVLFSQERQYNSDGNTVYTITPAGGYLNLNLGVRIAFSQQYAMAIKPELDVTVWKEIALYPSIGIGFEF